MWRVIKVMLHRLSKICSELSVLSTVYGISAHLSEHDMPLLKHTATHTELIHKKKVKKNNYTPNFQKPQSQISDSIVQSEDF